MLEHADMSELAVLNSSGVGSFSIKLHDPKSCNERTHFAGQSSTWSSVFRKISIFAFSWKIFVYLQHTLARDRLSLTSAHPAPNFLPLDNFTKHSDIREPVLQHCNFFVGGTNRYSAILPSFLYVVFQVYPCNPAMTIAVFRRAY